MEQNNFEELEAVEIEENKDYKPEPELKEYQKLLIKEANREDYEKALNLVKFGCFSQAEVEALDFKKLESIPTEKKFKGIYKLYRNLETMELLFVCPLVENNKGDSEENKNMKPYAYDVITIEAMDDETYKMVCKSAKNNLFIGLKALYYGSFAAVILLAVITLAIFITSAIYPTAPNLIGFLISFFAYGGINSLIGVAIMLPLLVLISIKFKSYKDK